MAASSSARRASACSARSSAWSAVEGVAARADAGCADVGRLAFAIVYFRASSASSTISASSTTSSSDSLEDEPSDDAAPSCCAVA